MSSQMIEFVVLAAIALFVGWRLYITLGQDSGPPEGRSRTTEAPLKRQPDTTGTQSADILPIRPQFTGVNAAGLEDIYNADNSFDPSTFMQGARAAYEMIVAAFARGDRNMLKPMLDDDVYEAWDAVITQREQDGTHGMELLRIRKAELTDASLADDGMARIIVQFTAELGDGENTARASELWTFMRQTRVDDPNWILDDVDTVD